MRLCPSLCSVRRLRVPRLFGKEAREHGERAGGQGSEPRALEPKFLREFFAFKNFKGAGLGQVPS